MHITTLAEEPPIALVYRSGCVACGRACCPHSKGRGRQYAFDTQDQLAAWLARKPYRDELHTVIPVFGRRLLPQKQNMNATAALLYVGTARAAVQGGMLEKADAEWLGDP